MWATGIVLVAGKVEFSIVCRLLQVQETVVGLHASGVCIGLPVEEALRSQHLSKTRKRQAGKSL